MNRLDLRVVIGALLAVGAAATASAEPHPFFSEPFTLGAHRGGADLWPESTALAYRECAERWPNILLEADVYVTKDGHVVVSHDATVDRTTDGSGKIAGLTLEEVKQLDAGYNFTTDGETYPHRGQGLKMLTLKEAFAAAPNQRWLVETKSGEDVMAKTIAVIEEAGMEDKVLLASFTPAHLEYAREHAPEIARCFDRVTGAKLMMAMQGDWDGYEPEDQVLSLMRRMVDQFNVTPEMLAKLKEKGIYSQVHTLNTREEIDTYLEMGFDSILTDRPDLLADAVNDIEAAD